jgi:hypothetical protein
VIVGVKDSGGDWDRCAAGREVIDDRPWAKAKGLEQSSIYVRPAGPQVHSEKKAAQKGITMGNAVAVPPIKRHEMVLAQAQAGSGRVVRREVLVDSLGARKPPHESRQSIAEAGLSRLVAPEAGEHSVASHSFDSMRQGPLLVIGQEEYRRCAERTEYFCRRLCVVTGNLQGPGRRQARAVR